MIQVIFDTNVILQSLLSSPTSASVRVLDAYFAGQIRLVFSQSTLDELIEVLAVPRLRARHGLSDDEIVEFVESLLTSATIHPGTREIPSGSVRDITDRKFLALALESAADYLITNDRRHLRPLGSFYGTEIVTAGEFVEKLTSTK